MAKAAIHRENLVNTAMGLFRRQGYASTGLQEILNVSGAPKGSLYYYFPKGKESLGEAAVELAGEMIAKMLTELAEKHRTSKAFIRGYCQQMARWMEESDFRSGCPIATTVLETAPQSALITRAGNQAIESWIDVIAGVFEKEQLSSKQARERAELTIAAIEGALILARLRQSTQPILNIARGMVY